MQQTGIMEYLSRMRVERAKGLLLRKGKGRLLPTLPAEALMIVGYWVFDGMLTGSLMGAAVGIPSTIAVSATLVYRIAFYWLRIPMGAVAMKWLDRHNLI